MREVEKSLFAYSSPASPHPPSPILLPLSCPLPHPPPPPLLPPPILLPLPSPSHSHCTVVGSYSDNSEQYNSHNTENSQRRELQGERVQSRDEMAGRRHAKGGHPHCLLGQLQTPPTLPLGSCQSHLLQHGNVPQERDWEHDHHYGNHLDESGIHCP